MELLQLKYFCDAAKTENFSKTAEHYRLPPSAISQAIKRLECELDTPLFDRKANKITLNEQGRLLLAYATQALAALEEARTRIKDSRQEVTGEIRLLIATNRRLVTQAIEQFKTRYPSVTFLLDHRANENREYDLIVSDDDSLAQTHHARLLLTEQMLLAMRDDHPLARQGSLSGVELQEAHFIAMNEGSRLSQTMTKICGTLGFAPQVTIRCEDPYYVRQYVELGLGITIVPSFSWNSLFSDHVVFRELGDFTRSTYVFWKKERYLPRAAELFLTLLATHCEASPC